MRIKYLLLMLVLAVAACHNHSEKEKVEENTLAFDPIKWKIREGKTFPYRDRMLNDLMKNHKLHGKKRDSVLMILGTPSRIDTGYLFYTVSQQMLTDLIPLHTKTLVLKFYKDSTVEWMKIHQ